MSLVVTETRSSEHEGAFLNFCQAVSDSLAPIPYWDRNLKQFNKIFLKYRAHGKSHLPILAFAGSRRDVLEAPIVDETGECNDAWLRLPKDEVVPVPPTWLPVRPRGVYLPMKDDEPIHSLPLAEIYARCIEISNGSQSYFGVTPSSAPAKFLFLFYQMLHEADPENEPYQTNMTVCQEMITSNATTANPFTGALSGLSAILTPEAQNGIQGMMENVATTFTPESRSQAENAFTTFQQTGDLGSLITGFQPLLTSPGVQNLFATIMPAMTGMMATAGVTMPPVMPGATTPVRDSDGASATVAPSEVVLETATEEIDPECAALE